MINQRATTIMDQSSVAHHRIPLALQNVFLASNQGVDVNDAPIEVANKTFEKKIPPPCRKLSSSSNNQLKKQGSIRNFHLNLKRLVPSFSSRVGTGTKTTTESVVDAQPSSSSSIPSKPKRKPLATLSPQDYLDGILRSRGCTSGKYPAFDTGYYNKPTSLQIASYGSYTTSLLRRGEHDRLRTCLSSGLSANPSNQYGESMAHLACRLRSSNGLTLLLQSGCDIRFVDDKGRTPLHDACWTHKPCFELIKIILEVDWKLLLVADVRGFQPLSYAPQQSWSDWLEFLATNRDTFWPVGGHQKVAALGASIPKDLLHEKPNSRPLPNPTNALPNSIAKRIAEGTMTLEAALVSCRNTVEKLFIEYADISTTSDDSESEYDEEDDLDDFDEADDNDELEEKEDVDNVDAENDSSEEDNENPASNSESEVSEAEDDE